MVAGSAVQGWLTGHASAPLTTGLSVKMLRIQVKACSCGQRE